MTIFEFLSVAASIVLALGLSRLITSIPYVFDTHKRDWLHALTFVGLFAAHILIWWRIWPLHSVTSWNLLGFAILMGSPLSLCLAATAMVSSNPDQVGNWKEQFSERSPWIFSAFAAVMMIGILRGYVLLDITPEWWSIVVPAGLVVAAFSSRRSFHIAGVIFILLALARVAYVSFSAPLS